MTESEAIAAWWESATERDVTLVDYLRQQGVDRPLFVDHDDDPIMACGCCRRSDEQAGIACRFCDVCGIFYTVDEPCVRH